MEGVGRHVDGLGETSRNGDADEFHVGADVSGARSTVVTAHAGVQGLDGIEGVGEAGASVDK